MPNKWIVIAVAAICTYITRVVPFALFGGKKGVPDLVKYLGLALPPAIIATLIIYCLKDVEWLGANHGLAELIAVALVGGSYAWKRNTLVSMALGTISYMLMIQFVFV